MTCKCLVTFREKNFVLPFDGPMSRTALMDSLKDHEFFRGVDVATVVVTVFDEDFKVFVDMPEDYVVLDKAKIKVSENSQVRIADVLERDVPAQQPLQQPHISATYSLTYSLPAVPQDVQASIGRHQPGTYFKGRNRVVQWLYHDLCVYTMYPGKLYAEAAQALVARYPNLADSSGTGYDSWREALRFKAKYERRKIRLQDDGAENSPPAKKAAKDAAEKEGIVNDNVPQRVARPSMAAATDDGEDDESIAGNVSAIKKEMLKARPDVGYIADCMRRTLSSRRRWIDSKESPPVEKILEEYPALSISSIAQLEFELLTGVPVLRSLEQALDQAKEKIVQAARQKRHLEGFLEDLDACLSGASEATAYEATITAAICLIPGLLKERRESFVCDFDPAAVHYTPMVVHQGDVLRTTDFTACLEDIRIPEKSLLAALASQMSLYWAFNIVFFKKSSRTFDLLCRLIKVESGLRPTPLVRMAQTVLEK